MVRDGLINRLFVAEVQCFDTFERFTSSIEYKNHKESLKELLNILVEVNNANNLEIALAAEEFLLRRELTTYANSSEEVSSLTAALDQLDEAKKSLKIVCNSEVYKVGASTYPERRKENGLPLDSFREFVKSHTTRLGNRMASQLPEIEKEILRQRKNNLQMIKQFYILLQKKAMEL